MMLPTNNDDRTVSIIWGPMYSGKTFSLVNEVRKYKAPIIFDMVNTRNSDRDLSNIFSAELQVISISRLRGKLGKQSTDVVVFDEVQLYEVKGFQKEFMLAFEMSLATEADVLLAGLLFDGYRKCSMFPIWESIIPFATNIKNIESLQPCKECGALKNVFYTMPDDPSLKGEARVGDHYYNLCSLCFNKMELRK